MATHRRQAADEPDALRRLARVLGTATAGWTPQQPSLAEGQGSPEVAESGDHHGGWRVSPHPSALTWLLVAGLAVLVVSGYLLSHHHHAATVQSDRAPAPTPVAGAGTPTT